MKHVLDTAGPLRQDWLWCLSALEIYIQKKKTHND